MTRPFALAPARWPRWELSTDTLALCTSLFFALACNGPFLRGALAGRAFGESGTWLFAAGIVVMLVAIHLLLLGALLHRWWARPLLAVVIVAAALASWFVQQFGIVLDPGMLRNVLRTHYSEASELIGWSMVPHMALLAGLPLLLLARVRVARRPWRGALARRAALLLAAGAVLVLVLWLTLHDLSSLMRNQQKLRYMVTPANLIYSTARVLHDDGKSAQAARQPIGLDARRDASWPARDKPALLVIVVGETARAANWGLNGYARQTTPELAARDVLNFSNVTACGTDTETSLPCMFAPVGRRNYDAARIRGSESLLHLLHRAGFEVFWRDNQSGCKGVCDGLPSEVLDAAKLPELCTGGRCLDQALLHGLDALATRQPPGKSLVLVLHMLGNHGPAYYRRHPGPPHFTPACEVDDLRQCSVEQIVNSYDNALRYTDAVLAQTIAWLEAQQPRFDTAMLYVSDHGESLGEKGLFLHGMPYAIAPKEQTQVPMVWWLSPGFARGAGVDLPCLAGQTPKAWSHDHLFHSVVGLLRVSASEYEAAFDIGAPCRR